MSLTVVVPTLGRKTLTRTVESVQQQTVPTKIMVGYDEFRFGASNMRNLMISSVKTSWVGFCDDDDWLDPRYHEWLTRYEDQDMVVFQMQRPDGMVLPDHIDIERLAYNWVGVSFALKTSIAKQFPFKDMIGEDFELIRRVRQAGLQVVVSPRVAYFVG